MDWVLTVSVTAAVALLTASGFFGLPDGLLSAVCWVESKHQVSAINAHDNGSPSIGLCQLKLETARGLGYRGTAKTLRQDAGINSFYAGKYLRRQLERYDGDIIKAVAAYNSGTYHLGRHGKPRNLKYVNRVLKCWKENR